MSFPFSRNRVEMFLSPLSAAVQEACLLSMLRIVADCDEVPPDVMAIVTDLGEFAGRHIRRVSFISILKTLYIIQHCYHSDVINSLHSVVKRRR